MFVSVNKTAYYDKTEIPYGKNIITFTFDLFYIKQYHPRSSYPWLISVVSSVLYRWRYTSTEVFRTQDLLADIL